MNETMTFTVGQLIAVVGVACLVAITIYLVGLLKETRKTMRQLNETLDSVNEIVEDVQATKMVVTSKIAEFKKMSGVVQTFKEMKEKRERKKNKK